MILIHLWFVLQNNIISIINFPIDDWDYAINCCHDNVFSWIQVWEVRIWKLDPSNKQKKTLVSSSRVTLLCNMPVPDNAKDAGDKLRKHARLWMKLFNLHMHKQNFSCNLKHNKERIVGWYKKQH